MELRGALERRRSRRQIEKLLKAADRVAKRPDNEPQLNAIDTFNEMLANLAMYADFYDEIGDRASAAHLRVASSAVLAVVGPIVEDERA